MKIIKNIIFIILILSLNSCGNFKANRLPEGVCDKAGYSYPPNTENSSQECIEQND